MAQIAAASEPSVPAIEKANEAPGFGQQEEYVKNPADLQHAVEAANHPRRRGWGGAGVGALEGAALGAAFGGIPGAAVGGLAGGALGYFTGRGINKKKVEDATYNANMADKVAIANNAAFNANKKSVMDQYGADYMEKTGKPAPPELVSRPGKNMTEVRAQDSGARNPLASAAQKKKNIAAIEAVDGEPASTPVPTTPTPGAPVPKSALTKPPIIPNNLSTNTPQLVPDKAPLPIGSNANPVAANNTVKNYGPRQWLTPEEQNTIRATANTNSMTPSIIAKNVKEAENQGAQAGLNFQKTNTEKGLPALHTAQATAALSKANYDRVQALGHPAVAQSQVNKNNADAKRSSQPSDFQGRLQEVVKMGKEGILDTEGENTLRAGLAGQLHGKSTIKLYHSPVVRLSNGQVMLKDPKTGSIIGPPTKGVDYTELVLDPATQAMSALTGAK